MPIFAKVKSQIRSSKAKLVEMYWSLGEKIAAKQSVFIGRNNFIDWFAKDLKNEFLGINGFSRTNLFSIRQFYLLYTAVQQIVRLQPDDENLVQPSAETVGKLARLMPLLAQSTTIEEFETELIKLEE